MQNFKLPPIVHNYPGVTNDGPGIAQVVEMMVSLT